MAQDLTTVGRLAALRIRQLAADSEQFNQSGRHFTVVCNDFKDAAALHDAVVALIVLGAA